MTTTRAVPWAGALLLLLGACGDDGAQPGTAAAPAVRAPGASQAPSSSPDSAPQAPSSSEDGWFTDVTATSGLDFVHDAGMTPEKHLPETMGAGAALADLDGDGDLDAYLVQSGPLPGARPDPSRVNRLFANDGGGHFTDVTATSGDAAHAGYGMGVAVGDVDSDGDLDLFVTNLGPDALLVNEGDLHFRDDTARAGLGDPRWTTSAAFLDADGDGHLDLYVAAYVAVDLDEPLWCGRRDPGWRSYCHPDAYAGEHDRFYRNLGDGRFEDVTVAAGLFDPEAPGKGLGVLVVDVDGDLRPDLYVANDSVENRLWIHVGEGRFEDGTLLSGTGVNGRGLTEAGMGVAAGDVDGDGDDEIFVTNFDDESNTLYRNDGAGLFTDVTAPSGLDGPSRLPVGFGTVMSDLDADGDLDIAVVNGHIIDNIPLYHDGKTWAQHALLFTNDGLGRFADASAVSGDLCAEPRVGRCLASGDVDGDGDVDLLLTGCNERARLLVNRGAPVGTAAGASLWVTGLPRGSRVTATLADGRVLVRTAGPQSTYLGQTSPDVHLGLGTSALRDLAVALPPGTPTALQPAASPVRFEPPLGAGRLVLGENGWLHSPHVR